MSPDDSSSWECDEGGRARLSYAGWCARLLVKVPVPGPGRRRPLTRVGEPPPPRYADRGPGGRGPGDRREPELGARPPCDRRRGGRQAPRRSLGGGAPQEAAAALRVVVGEETINFALAALFNILFAGVTFILYGLALAWSGEHPRWLGWIVAVAGAGSVPVGLVQAYAGESVPFTRVATIVFPRSSPCGWHGWDWCCSGRRLLRGGPSRSEPLPGRFLRE